MTKNGKIIEFPEELAARVDTPFEGLFGSLSQQKVLQEIVADPYSMYTPKDIIELTELTEPTVRDAIQTLLDKGILRNTSGRISRPIYEVNLDSKRLTALTFLTYAILDDRLGSDSMAGAVKHFCDVTQGSYLNIRYQEETSSSPELYQHAIAMLTSHGKDCDIIAQAV